MNEDLFANDIGSAFNHRVGFGNNFLPVCPVKREARRFQYMKPGRILIAGEVKLTVQNPAVVQEILTVSNALEFARCSRKVFQIKLCSGPALAYLHQQPAAIIGKNNIRPVLRINAVVRIREDQRIMPAGKILVLMKLVKKY